jgi:hypothetical protein
MPEKSIPPNISEILAPLWVYLIAGLGSLVGYFEDFKLEDTWQVKILKLLTRLSASAFAGVMTYHLCSAFNLSEVWRIPLVGIAGHMGVEALKAMGEVWKSKFSKPPGP